MPCPTCGHVHPAGVTECAAPPVVTVLSFTGFTSTGADDQGNDRREIEGIAVPYGEETVRFDWLTGATRWVFEEGSVSLAEGAQLFYGHDHMSNGLPVGRIVSAEHTPEGFKIRARFANTPKADEVYALCQPDQDGVAVLDRFSIGFQRDAATTRLEDPESDSPLLVFEDVPIWETSVVPLAQFHQSARVTDVLKGTHQTKENHMPCTKCGTVHAAGVTECQVAFATSDDVTALASSLDNLERRIATLGAPAPSGPAVPGASYGDFLQLAAAGDPGALEFLAYVGGTTDDLGDLLKDTWVGDRYKIVEATRTCLNFFARSPLPATGMGIEYGVEGTDTTKVEEQVNEGDTLAYGSITFDTAHAKLKTYGGWGEMSRQEIERSPINVVERFYDALLRRYARVTEAAANTQTVAGGEALAGGVLDMTTVDGWTRFAIRAARVMKDRGYPLEGLLVGFDVFEDLALMRDGDQLDAPRFLDRRTGSINVTGLSGEVFNVPVIPIETGNTPDVIRAANSEAIRTYEAGGAPFRLQDDDITNLTKAFSIYGYMATVTEVPGALIKPATV